MASLIESPLAVSLQDIANIVTFIAPGYIALAVYSLKYAKGDKNFSKILVESVVWSLPLVALANEIWVKFFHKQSVASLNIGYAFLVLALAIIGGYVFAELRVRWPINKLASRFGGLDSPHEDFIRTHFANLKQGEPVSVKLKSGTSFSGTPSSGSIYTKNGPRKYCFDFVAWYDDDAGLWQETNSTVMVDLKEVEYIVSPGRDSPSVIKPRMIKRAWVILKAPVSKFWNWKKAKST
jgi:hypothetical protein